MWTSRIDTPASPSRRVREARGLDVSVGGGWYVGTLECLRQPCVAVVGTRAATPLGKRLAREFGHDLGAAGCTVISGLALGIDAAAHEGALQAGAPTVGVLGGGHRHFFPPRNRELAERMVAGRRGRPVSLRPRYGPDAVSISPTQRLVAALADALVVVEAPAKSGALNTAGGGGRTHSDVRRPRRRRPAHVAGCLALIRDGATLARSAADVLDAHADRAGSARPRSVRAVRSRRPGDRGGARANRRAPSTSWPPPSVSACPALLAALTSLELRGFVESRGPGVYARKTARKP